MGAVSDLVQLELEELLFFKAVFPSCVVLPAHTETTRYRVIIPDLTEEDYYLRLVDNCLALCSANFLARVESDELFARMMRGRLAENLRSGRPAELNNQ